MSVRTRVVDQHQDIIHPRNGREINESEFFQKWEKKEKTTRVRSIRKDWLRSDVELCSRFKRLFATGMSYKRISSELEIDVYRLHHLRISLNLQPRNKRGSETLKRHMLTINIPKDLIDKMNRYCVGRYQSKAHLVRALLRERLD